LGSNFSTIICPSTGKLLCIFITDFKN
jgi:hypothetical protein